MLGVNVDITTHKRTEEALQQYSDRLTLAIEAARLGLWNWDVQSNQVVWTPYHESLLGYEPGTPERSYQDWVDRVHPDDLPQVQAAAQAAMENQQDYESDYRVIWPDGSVHWISSFGRFQYDANGQPIQMLGALFDITDRKQAEIAVRDSEEKLSLFIRQAPVSVAMLDRNMRYITTSQRWVDICKIESIEALIGRSHYDLFPNLPDSWKQVHQECLAGAIHKCDEDWFLLPDGSEQWLRWEVRPWYDSTGEVGGIVIFSEDISDRKRAEAEREQLLQQLEVSLGQLEAVINNMTEGLIIADAQGNILMFNPAALAWHGYDSVEQVQQHLDEFHHIFETQDLQGNFIPVEEWPIAKALRGETFSNWEIQIRRLDTGKTCICSHGGTPVHDKQGRIVLAIVTMHDVTDQRQAQAELARSLAAEQAARADAEAANRVKDEFLAILSHELRTPLNPILGWTRLLRTRTFNPEMTERALETIERNAKLQTKLIEDLLDVSCILRGKVVLDVCPVNLVRVIEAALETVQLAAEAKGIQMQKFFATNVGQVSGESARLQQVVWNLLSNAVKFTPTGGQIEVRLEQVNSVAQIQVKDTGKGISQEFLPYVFEYFRQENGTTTRQFGGLGLGLAIVRHLVELHGGTVQADSPGEGRGATFRVQLPLLATVSKIDLDSPLTHETLKLSGIRVLIVDDEPDMRELVSFILQEHGAQVTVAASAQEALQLLAQSMPDVLLSDIGMPDMDGYTLMRQVRTLPPEQGGLIRAIALTAYAGELDQQQALAAGFQQHITKPVEPEKLIEAIANLLGHN
jgi:PAS domain S-box-containing protein